MVWLCGKGSCTIVVLAKHQPPGGCFPPVHPISCITTCVVAHHAAVPISLGLGCPSDLPVCSLGSPLLRVHPCTIARSTLYTLWHGSLLLRIHFYACLFPCRSEMLRKRVLMLSAWPLSAPSMQSCSGRRQTQSLAASAA